MANDLYSVLTRDEAIEDFITTVLPAVVEECEQDGELDEIARSEAWSNFADALRANKRISDWQYDNWTHPDECERDTAYSRRIIRSNSYTFTRPMY